MKDPAQPDVQRDEYLPDQPNAHKSQAPFRDGINPQAPSSMPRGEDDEKTRADSPEFHDRPDAPLGTHKNG